MRRTTDALHVSFLAREMPQHVFLQEDNQFNRPLSARTSIDRDLQFVQLTDEFPMLGIDLPVAGFEFVAPSYHQMGAGKRETNPSRDRLWIIGA
jgi:hypothetical protein